MPKPGHRSRSLRRIHIKTPGGTNKIHYKKRKPSPAKCSACGAILKAVPRLRPYKMQTTAKSKKRPERPYGGTLCSKCTRETIVQKARANV